MGLSPIATGGIIAGVLVVGFIFGWVVSGGTGGSVAQTGGRGDEPSPVAKVPEDGLAEVRALLAAGPSNHIHAIKLVRGRTGLGLMESKDVVDSMLRGA